MPDDVEDPVLLADAEREMHAASGGQARNAVRGRRVAWVCALVLVVFATIVAAGKIRDRAPSLSNVTGVYDYYPPPSEVKEPGGWVAGPPLGCTAVMTLRAGGSARVEWADPLLSSDAHERSGAFDCEWSVAVGLLQLSGRPKDFDEAGCAGVGSRLWHVLETGRGLVLSPAFPSKSKTIMPDGRSRRVEVNRGRYVLRTHN